jgi:hypothetical protein
VEAATDRGAGTVLEVARGAIDDARHGMENLDRLGILTYNAPR